MRGFSFTVVTALLLTGCIGEEPAEKAMPKQSDLHASIEAAVLAKLKDPYSAKIEFTGEYRRRDEKLICGTVNARNALGGYVGDRVFLAWVDGSGATPRISVPDSDEDNQIASSLCKDWDGKH